MVMSIGSGYAAAVSNRHLDKTDRNLGLELARLSAGKRVLSAKDDAASLAIGSRLEADVSAQRQAYQNAGQAASMLRVADGGMGNTSDILTRMKSLAVQASSGQLSADDRRALNTEFQQLASEVERISSDTEFAGTNLLDGSTAAVDVKVGTGTGPSDEVSADLADTSTASLGLTGLDISTEASADAASAAITNAIDAVQDLRADNGASQSRLDYARDNIATGIENTEAARSNLLDLDVADATARKILLQTQLQAGVYASQQSNRSAKSMLSLLA